MASVIARLRERADTFEVSVAVTAQHRDMLDQVLDLFEIRPDFDLDLMRHGQSLTDIMTRSLSGMSSIIEVCRPDVVLVQGDTSTTFAAALAAFYHRVSVGHVEAGLRSDDLYQPFPEEVNRRLTSQVASLHFAPTVRSRDRLLAEGAPSRSVFLTGNTVIDALLDVADRPHEFSEPCARAALRSGRRIVLVTMHRRENWGEPIRSVCRAVVRLVHAFPDVHVLFTTHANPDVRSAVTEVLDGVERVDILGPQQYLPFTKLMEAATLILSDSGGVQEEAPSLGKPVLVLRNVTERPEAVESGVALLVGTDEAVVFDAAATLLGDGAAYATMAHAINPFGDGHASERIADVLGAVDLRSPWGPESETTE